MTPPTSKLCALAVASHEDSWQQIMMDVPPGGNEAVFLVKVDCASVVSNHLDKYVSPQCQCSISPRGPPTVLTSAGTIDHPRLLTCGRVSAHDRRVETMRRTCADHVTARA